MPSTRTPLLVASVSLLLLAACQTPVPGPDVDTTDDASSAPAAGAAASSEDIAPVSGLEATDAEWNRYTSGLGFSMLLPKAVKPDFDHPTTAVAAFEDPRSNRVFIAPETFYRAGEAHTTSLEDLSAQGHPDVPAWEIITREVADDAALRAFVRERFGKSCQVTEQKPTAQDGTLDVRLEGTGPESDCFLNYVLAVRYSPTLKRAAAWTLGQDITFVGVGPSTNPAYQARVYDEDMLKSFRFE